MSQLLYLNWLIWLKRSQKSKFVETIWSKVLPLRQWCKTYCKTFLVFQRLIIRKMVIILVRWYVPFLIYQHTQVIPMKA
jgi:hypothetical protein